MSYLYWIMFIFLLSMVPTTALELYRTDRINKNATLCQFIYYDCLLYHVSDTIVAYGSVGARGIIPYCMRPLAAKNISEERSGHVGEVILFEYLRKDGVREEDLLSWSAPVDLVEMYLAYVEKSDVFSSAATQVFYNCTPLWFGSHCEYTFGTDPESFDDIVIATFQAKKPPWNDHSGTLKPLDYTNLTCYVHLTCDRGPRLANCLDWREVCDG
jgi:hypothetical protein